MSTTKKTVQQITPKVVTRLQYKPSKGETNTQDSLTIPNDTLSIKQLLENHARGLGTMPYAHGYYTEDEVAPKYTDPLDRLRDVENLKQRIADFEEKEKQSNAQKEQTAKEDVQSPIEQPTAEN